MSYRVDFNDSDDLEELTENLEEEPEYVVKKFIRYLMIGDEGTYFRLRRYAVFNGFDRLIELFNKAGEEIIIIEPSNWEFDTVYAQGRFSPKQITELNGILNSRTVYTMFEKEDPHVKERVVELLRLATRNCDNNKLKTMFKELEEITYMP